MANVSIAIVNNWLNCWRSSCFDWIREVKYVLKCTKVKRREHEYIRKNANTRKTFVQKANTRRFAPSRALAHPGTSAVCLWQCNFHHLIVSRNGNTDEFTTEQYDDANDVDTNAHRHLKACIATHGDPYVGYLQRVGTDSTLSPQDG